MDNKSLVEPIVDINAVADEAAELIRRSNATVASEFAITQENCPSNPAFTTTAALAGRLAKPGCHCFGLRLHGMLVGFSALMPAGSGEDGALEVTRLAVLPEHRHKGYGKALLDASVNKAIELGARKATIGIIDANAVLKKWYLSYGFVETAIKRYPFLPFVVCEMELSLPAGRSYHPMSIDDYDEVNALWGNEPGIGLSDADSRSSIEAYLARNPGQSFVCKAQGRVIGTILCGNDGRRAYIYHAAVAEAHRRNGVAAELVRLAMAAQKGCGINKGHLFIFCDNEAGKAFWREVGFVERHDVEIMSKSIVGDP